MLFLALFCLFSLANADPPRALLNSTFSEIFPEATALYDMESRLFRKLFDSYVRDARPARVLGNSVDVCVDMMIMKINQLVERDQEIILSGYLKIAWKDERLAWDPQEYGGLEWIVAPSSNIWIPDIGLINSADMYSITRDYRFPAVVDYMGNVIWVPAGKFAARCELDVTYFPFDNQTCFYRFESWSYPSDFLNITGQTMVLSQAHYVPDQQWNVTSIHVKTYVVSYEAGLYSFSRIDYVLKLRRKPLYYVTYTIMPALALSFLQVFSHLLPVADSNRIAFATTTLIAFSVVHVSVSENMPKTSDSVPLIAIYVDVVMCLIAGSLIEAFLTANCLEKAKGSLPPKWLWDFVIDILGRFVFVSGEKFQAKYVELRRMLESREKFIVDKSAKQTHHRRTKSAKKNQNSRHALPVDLLPPSPLTLPRNFHLHHHGGLSQPANSLANLTTSIDGTFHANSRTDFYQSNLPWNIDQFSAQFDSKMRLNQLQNMPPYSSLMGSSSPHAIKHQLALQQQQQQQQHCHTCSNLIDTLTGVYQDVALLRKLCDDLAERQLKELSREVWNALLSVIDRYIFVVALCVAVLTPLYLFIILPPDAERSITPTSL